MIDWNSFQLYCNHANNWERLIAKAPHMPEQVDFKLSRHLSGQIGPIRSFLQLHYGIQSWSLNNGPHNKTKSPDLPLMVTNWVSQSVILHEEQKRGGQVWIWTQVKGFWSPGKKHPIFHWHEKDNVYGFLLEACALPKGSVVEEGDIWTTHFTIEEKFVHSSVQQFFTMS